MKLTLRLLCVAALIMLTEVSTAQCTQAQLNWDYLDYYYNTNGAPYGSSSTTSYVSTAMEQTQKFAIGPTYVTFAVSASGVVKGENATHTGDLTGYTGQDAQFTPTAGNQTITLTFATEVQNVSFALYDIDNKAKLDLTAANAANTAQTINVTAQATTILSISGNNTTAATVEEKNGTAVASTVNDGSAIITVAGPVKTIVIKVSNIGSDPTFWMSDIDACVPGSFPTNYHQMAAEKPFAGQPSYFITTDDDKYVYMIDPTTGKATYLFSETQFTNSFAYDQVHHWLYYVLDGSSTATKIKNNKTLKKYDFNSETSSVVISDITTTLNIPTFDGGIESAGACFYNGDLYLGIEGGSYNSTNTRETIVYRLTLDASGVPTSAAQVYATPAIDVTAASNDNSIHDWGDFFVKDGVLVDFNTARNKPSTTYTYNNQDFVHFDLMSGQVVNDYINPTPTQVYVGQAGMDWSGNLYSIWTDKGNNTVGIKKYNMDGTLGSNVSISVTGRSPAWIGGSGDASEPFRPKVDFGDAPPSYDPATGDPAVHDIDSNLYIGTGFDKEFVTRGQTALANSDNLDDGITTVPIFVSSSFSYQANVKVMNKTGANATLVAWLDFNGNDVFDPSEGIVKTVSSSGSAQTISLFWPSPTAFSTLQTGDYTYLRIRITYATNNMTVNNPTGYFSAGEVEDYRVVVNSYPLATTLHTFDASLDANKSVQLKWNIDDESNIESYTIEKSSNSKNWELVTSLLSKNGTGLVNYESADDHPLPGTSYYRLRILRKDGKTQFSDLKRIDINLTSPLLIAPNPAIDKASVYINSNVRKQATLQIINGQGAIVHNQNITLNAGANTIELPVATKLNSGRYLVRITTDQNTISQSLIVNK